MSGKPKKTIGYCAVTADILHYGHLIFICQCRSKCDYLIVGIMTDECVKKYKKRYPLFSQIYRMVMVGNLKQVNKTIYQNDFEFDLEMLRKRHKVDIIFDSEEHKEERKGADCYIPYTNGISSSWIKWKITSG